MFFAIKCISELSAVVSVEKMTWTRKRRTRFMDQNCDFACLKPDHTRDKSHTLYNTSNHFANML